MAYTKEQSKEYQKKYYQDNKEKVKVKNKKWAKDNPEKVKAALKKYAENNVMKLRKKARDRKRVERLNNPERVKKRRKEWEESNPGYYFSEEIKLKAKVYGKKYYQEHKPQSREGGRRRYAKDKKVIRLNKRVMAHYNVYMKLDFVRQNQDVLQKMVNEVKYQPKGTLINT